MCRYGALAAVVHAVVPDPQERGGLGGEQEIHGRYAPMDWRSAIARSIRLLSGLTRNGLQAFSLGSTLSSWLFAGPGRTGLEAACQSAQQGQHHQLPAESLVLYGSATGDGVGRDDYRPQHIHGALVTLGVLV